MNGDQVLISLALIAALAGIVGGLLAAGAILWAQARWPQVLLAGVAGRYVIPLDVQLHAEAVRLPVRVTQPDPVTVEVVTGPAPTTRELAARVIAAMPAIGPTDLSTILQCSKSTAHAIIQDARAGRLVLPTVPEVGDDE